MLASSNHVVKKGVGCFHREHLTKVDTQRCHSFLFVHFPERARFFFYKTCIPAKTEFGQDLGVLKATKLQFQVFSRSDKYGSIIFKNTDVNACTTLHRLC